jgi:hypothetical protein
LILVLATAALFAACSDGAATGAATRTPLPLVPSDEPIATPEPTATPVPLPVKVTQAPKTVSPGDRASIKVRTAKRASCSISVAYESGESEAKGLDPKKADSSGDVAWAWTVGINTNPQTAVVTVSCEAAHRTGTATADLTVR